MISGFSSFPDTRAFLTVAADLVFSDLKEPVRILKEAKAKVFPSNEKFWNPTKPRIHEEYTIELRQVKSIFIYSIIYLIICSAYSALIIFLEFFKSPGTNLFHWSTSVFRK